MPDELLPIKNIQFTTSFDALRMEYVVRGYVQAWQEVRVDARMLPVEELLVKNRIAVGMHDMFYGRLVEPIEQLRRVVMLALDSISNYDSFSLARDDAQRIFGEIDALMSRPHVEG